MIRRVKIHNISISQLIEAQVKENPHATAVILDQRVMTYAELNQHANQLAHYLDSLGIKSEQRIAICLERSIDVLIAMIAILKVGACYVPLDPKQPYERLSFILKDSQAAACITKSNLTHAFHYKNSALIIYDEMPEIENFPTTNLDKTQNSQSLAYVIYTSGTTGKPKGVLIEHQSVINYCHWFANYSHAKPTEKIDWSSNYMFDMAVTSTIIPLMLGLTIVICPEDTQRHFKQYLAYLKFNHVNIIKVTPSYFKEVLREVKANFIALTSLRTIVLGGEQLSTTDCANWIAYYPHQTLINEYGPTEATVAFSHYPIDSTTLFSPDMRIPIGLPGNNMYHYIFDQNSQPVLEGEEGELYIGGQGLARGYLNLPELTQSRFVQDPFHENARLYRTGDLCRQLPNGIIEYLGRIDRQVKIRGFRIELNEVEQCIKDHPDIQDAVVFVREHARHGKQLIAYYILENTKNPLTYAQLHDYLLKKIPNYMVPVSMLEIESFPLSASGKLDLSLLPVDEVKTHSVTKARSNLERVIAKTWSKELGLSSIGIDENFWELGGHSLIAARIISKLNQLLDTDISHAQFCQALTVKQLASMIKKTAHHHSHNKITPRNKQTKVLPLSDFQTILWACKTFKPKAAKLNIISRKRVQGKFNINALKLAFASLLQKHKILSYRISKFFPVQIIGKIKTIDIIEKNLKNVADEYIEYILWESMGELMRFSSWRSNSALIKAKLFYLPDNSIELQIGIPHIISDGISIEVIFNELSEFYLQYQPVEPHQDKNLHFHPKRFINFTENDEQLISVIPNSETTNDVMEFSDYVYQEQMYIEERIKKDIIFWNEYLKDAHLFTFPKKYIINPTYQHEFSYSTYVPIASRTIHHLEVFCMHQHASFNEVLSAVIGLALMNCCHEANDNEKHIFMNIVKSARDNLMYDETIGCFIRIEPIKLLLNKTQTLMSLLKQVHDFTAKSSKFHQSSSMLKLASLNRFYRKKKNVTYFLTQLSIYLYRKALRVMKMNHEALRLCPSLSLLDEKKHFMIYLNIWNSFINPEHEKSNLFGLIPKRVKMYQYDLLAVDYLFEVCFLRDENNNKPYVVISSNLEPIFRERIANEIIRIMNDEMVTVTS